MLASEARQEHQARLLESCGCPTWSLTDCVDNENTRATRSWGLEVGRDNQKLEKTQGSSRDPGRTWASSHAILPAQMAASWLASITNTLGYLGLPSRRLVEDVPCTLPLRHLLAPTAAYSLRCTAVVQNYFARKTTPNASLSCPSPQASCRAPVRDWKLAH